MKRLLAIILSCAVVMCLAACGTSTNDAKTTADSTKSTEKASKTDAEITKEKLDAQLKRINFKGIVCITHNGEIVYQSVTGNDEKGNPLELDTPMYIGSVSKQFCATAIMMLKEQGKLSLDDKLSKYFPEFEYGKDVTLKNMLTMRSGISEFSFSDGFYSEDKEEIFADMKNYVFSQPLSFEPDTKYEYRNSNYILLGNIVEQVSGMSYNEFVRENIFKPLDMTSSGFVYEVPSNPDYSAHLTFDTLNAGMLEAIIATGAGDIVTTAPDMEKWMTGLSSGKIISKESYEQMTQDYSPEDGDDYGFGLMGAYDNSVSHTGRIGNYTAYDYINVDKGYNLYAVTNRVNDQLMSLPATMLVHLMK